MPFTINEKKAYETTPDAVFQAVLGAVEGLQGKVEKQDGAARTVEARFDKTIHGKVLGDRTRMHVQVNGGDGHSELDVEIYPIDPVGRKLQFGARKGVARQVITWFFAHVEHRL
ncbi:MAG: hypothetical protein GX579_11040 [Chloroflexi bacterium]|jgi:hypothetical protein|nr:hypothetical protein [Chloroflexota bacterium]